MSATTPPDTDSEDINSHVKATECFDLSLSLEARANESKDQKLLGRAIDAGREALVLQSAGHPDRARFCQVVAGQLYRRFEWTDDEALLDDAIALEREAVDLWLPADDSNRGNSCANLARWLFASTIRRGDILLDEPMQFGRDALALWPAGHPRRDESCVIMAGILVLRFHTTGDVDVLDEATVLSREALLLRPVDHPKRASSCIALATCLSARYMLTGNNVLLGQVFELNRETMALKPVDHEDRAKVCLALAGALVTCLLRTPEPMLCREAMAMSLEALRLWRTDDTAPAKLCSELTAWLVDAIDENRDNTLLDQALNFGRQTIGLLSATHPARAKVCTDLAVMLDRHYSWTNDIASITEAVALGREALSLRPPNHPDRALSCSNLCTWLRINFQETRDGILLEDTIKFGREALALRSTGHPERADSCRELGLVLMKRYDETGDRASLNESVALGREALDLCPAGHADRALSCDYLADWLRVYFDDTRENTALNQAIEWGYEALALRPVGHSDRVGSCITLANLLERRYDQTGDVALIKDAIALGREARTLISTGHPDRALSCDNLAIFLRKQFEEAREMSLLDEATALSQEALSLSPVGHPDRSKWCNTLAFLYSVRWRYTGTQGGIHLLDRAITLGREALALDCRPVDHPERAWLYGNLADYLTRRIDGSTGSPAQSDMDEATEVLGKVLALRPLGHPERWRALIELASIAVHQQDWTPAINYLREALSTPTSDTSNTLEFASDVINRIRVDLVSCGQTEDMLQMYKAAIDLLTLATGVSVDTRTQLRHTLVARGLGMGAYTLAARMNKVFDGLKLLERARGVLWSQLLHMREPQFDEVPAHLAERLQDLIEGMGMNKRMQQDEDRPLPLSLRNVLYAQRSRIQDILFEIRSIPGLSNFMQGPDADTIMGTAAQHPVVIMIPSKDKCHAFIISPSIEERVDVPLTTEPAELTPIGSTPQHRGALNLNEAERLGFNKAGRPSPLSATLAKLWRAIVKPILLRLGMTKAHGRERPRVYWCLTGSFASTPIHAAGIYDGPGKECCADYVVSSYTPTLTALMRAQKRARAVSTDQVTLLGIAAEHAQDPSLPSLHHVAAEAQHLVRLASEIGAPLSLVDSMATKQEVLAMFESANIVHLACHGVQHPTEPHKSRFCLSSGNLTVSELMDMNLKNASIAFLSACETAKGDQKYADEAVHLAATMLFAGFTSVVATMWAMCDEDGPFVAKYFYEKLFEAKTIDANSVAYALDHAVTALRAKGVPPERWATFIHMGA